MLVTAAARGIGQAIAKAFVEASAKVHICDVDEEGLEHCQTTLGVSGTLTDVSKPDEVDALFADVEQTLGGLDVLVNNAGISGPTARVEDVSPAEWDRTMAVNINGQFYCVRRAVPLLKQAGGGAIINLASTAGLFGYPLRSPYAASKWAVVGFSKTLAMELGAFGIRVNAICPGSVNNPRMDGVIEREAAAKGVSAATIRQAYLGGVSLKTFIEPEEVAATALYLCSEAGAKISGQALSIDGHTETLRT